MKFILLFLFNISAFAASITSFVDLQQQINNEVKHINTKELLEILDNNKEALLIDIRTEAEIKRLGTIARGANIAIPRGWLEFRIQDYAKDTEIILYCGTGLRSPLAVKSLMELGYTNVKNYADGYFKWQEQGLPVDIADRYKQSFLYREVKQVIPGVYTSIGHEAPATYQNSGHNNNLSFIIGENSVLVFNAGGSYLLAKSLHEEIKKLTNKPVKYVVLENAQRHAMLGSNYWKQQGATIISHQLAYDKIKASGKRILENAINSLGDKMAFSEIVLPDETYTVDKTINLGNFKVELLYLGPSHSSDDIQLYLPNEKLLISGDIAFNQRMLPIFDDTNVDSWLEALEKLKVLKPKIIIPGHGDVTDLKTVMSFTKDYLLYLRKQIQLILDNGGGLNDAYNIDQSNFREWKTYNELHLRNAARLFNAMEFSWQ